MAPPFLCRKENAWIMGSEAAQRIGGRETTTSGATTLHRSWRADPNRAAVLRDDVPEPGEAAL
jgi:hypothetical protein